MTQLEIKLVYHICNLVRGIADGDIEADLEQQRMMQDIASVYFDVKDIPDRDAKGFDIEGKRVLVVRENGKDVYILLRCKNS